MKTPLKLGLGIGGLAFISLASYCGISGAICFKENLLDSKLLLMSFAAGLLFGLALFHLLNDSLEDIYIPANFDNEKRSLVGLGCCAFGFTCMLLLRTNHLHSDHEDLGSNNEERGSFLEKEQTTSDACPSETSIPNHDSKLASEKIKSCKDKMPLLVKVSTIFHSIIIGMFAYPAPKSGVELGILIVVLMCHQFFEGFAMFALYLADNVFTVVFCVSLSGPALFTMFVPIPEIFKSIAAYFNCVAAGILIYVSLFEALSHALEHKQPSNWGIWSFFIGWVIMFLMGFVA